MGGGLSRKKYAGVSGVGLEEAIKAPRIKAIKANAKKRGRRLTEPELQALYKIEDKLYLEKVEQRREREYRQNEAIKHIDAFLYSYAPTTKRVAKYPPNSPNGKGGQKYLWVKLDHRKYNKEKLEESLNYPESVIVDRQGNLYIAERAGDEPILLTNAEILAARTIPRRPSAPTLVDRTASSITVQWTNIKCCVDVWCLQWQKFGEIGTWKKISEMQKSTYGTIRNLPFAESIVFRVRAHNMVGWSDWGPASAPFMTLPGPPSQPQTPETTAVYDCAVEIKWDKIPDNGERIIGYEIRIKKANMPYDDFTYVHNGPLVEPGVRKHRINDLDDGTTYYVQIAAVNKIGRSDFSYAAAFTTTEAPIEVIGTPLRQHGDWREYWDDKRSRCIYFNVITGTKQKTTPYIMRQGIDDQDTMFRKRRYRLLRGIRTDSSTILYNAIHNNAHSPSSNNNNNNNGTQSPHSTHSPQSLNSPHSVHSTQSPHSSLSVYSSMRLGSPSSPLGANSIPRPVIRAKRTSIYESSFACVRKMSIPALHMKWRVEFLDEDGIDSGGLTKEWFIELVKSMMIPERKIFLQREGHQAGSFSIHPNILKKMSQDESIEHLRFCGRIFGKAVAERCMIGATLDPVLAQCIVGADFVECSMEALESVDPVFAKSLKWILNNEITSDFGETLCACRPDNTVVDFCPGGRNMDVTEKNKDLYVDGMIHFKLLDELQVQRDSFVEGFHSIIHAERIQGFQIDELNLMLTGKTTFDVDEFAKACKFEGDLDSDAPLVQWFWEILESMDTETRQAILRFATGCPTIPLDGFDPEFTLVCNQQLSPEALPRAHTCFNKLVLPPYSLHEDGKAQFEQKLKQAVEYGTVGFGLT
jgi:hypothetical protein